MSRKLEFDLSPEESEVFLQEAEELVLQLNEGLVQLESRSDQPEVIQEVFRAAHTLKGSGGVIGHHRMAEVLHSMETLLDRVRHGQMAVTPGLIDVLLDGADLVRILVDEVSLGEESGVDIAPALEILSAFVSGEAAEAVKEAAILSLTPEQEEQVVAAAAAGLCLVEVRGRIAPDSIAPAARALQMLLTLQQSGQVLISSPEMEELDDQWQGYLVQASVLCGDSAGLTRLLGAISEVEIEVSGPGIEVEEPEDGGAETAASPVSGVASPLEAPAQETKGSNGRRPAAPREATQVRWVRTSVERLDKLMNLVSELVTDRNRLMQVRGNLIQQYGEEDGVGELGEALLHVSTITDQLQDEVMRARMVAIEQVFNKFPRLVRDLTRQLDKQIDLVVEGQETELDRTVIEEINDPILHLVRNCVDHGVETPAERLKRGKPARGRLHLAARSEESHIIIVVEDDGGGIDPQHMRTKAVEKGLMDQEAARSLSDQEAVELIFRAGFSTAEKVSDVSGRGVGMDVVRTNIERLGGSVSVQTQVGQGTRFELKLPLTLAIFPALMVEVGGNAYAVPLTTVVEALHIRAQDIQTIRGHETIVTRGRVLPILCLDEFFGFEGTTRGDSRYVVEVRWGDATIGLAVHRLLGRQEVVIKPLGRMIGEVAGISGGTIMGDGRVALIMDIPSLVKAARRERQAAA